MAGQCVYILNKLGPIKAARGWVVALDFALKVFVYQFGIAIRAFNPAMFARDLQPDTRMTQRAFAAIASNAITVYDFDLRYRGCHRVCSLCLVAALKAL